MKPIYSNKELVGVCIDAATQVVVQQGLDDGVVPVNNTINPDGCFPGDGSGVLPDTMVFENMLNEEMESAPVAMCIDPGVALHVAHILTCYDIGAGLAEGRNVRKMGLMHLTHADSTYLALTPAIAKNIDSALDLWKYAGTDGLVDIMETDHAGYTNDQCAVWFKDTVVAMTKHNCDAQRVAVVLNLYNGFKDHGAGFSDMGSYRDDLLVPCEHDLPNLFNEEEY